MFNPVKASKNIKEEFIDYISTSFSFADSDLREQFIDELKGNVDSGPWLEINDIFKTGLSINDLIDEGVLSPLFRDLEASKPNTKLYKKRLPLDRPLYLHQEKAIRTIVGGHNAIVSTGTGSGKTNCFLIPVLNELLREKEKGTLGPGVRALFIYPMNALANDQMKNLRKILMCYPDITFGVYNGATESKEEDAVLVYESMFGNEPVPELRKRLKNELLSREEMKDNPPNILFTNYAMLEHLLLRPNDDVLFSKSDFRFVVLDEAHVYCGATGIETSILLRRLRARIASTKETRFILTSATLGDENCNNDVITFGKNLCGVDFQVSDIVRGQREPYLPASNTKRYPLSIFNELADEKNFVADVLVKYGLETDKNKSEDELLYDFLIDCDLYKAFRQNIDKISTLNEVQQKLCLDEKTAISFVSLCTRASKDGKQLIDARYHFFIRSLEGCYIALTDQPKLFLTRKKNYKENEQEYSVFEIAVCDDCGKFALVGKEENKHLVQVAKLEQEVDYYYLASEENEDIEEEGETKRDRYYLCPHCGAIVPERQFEKNVPCDHPKEDYIKIVKAKKGEIGARCGNCHQGYYQRLYLGNDAATSVLATSLYEELPEVEYSEEEEQTKTTNLFANAAIAKKKKESKKGKQFLAFSDSRQEAAKFACYLSKSYDEFLRRRGICQIIKENKSDILAQPYTISDFVTKLTSYFTNKRSFASSYSDNTNLTVVSKKNAWVAMLNELARYSSSTSLTSLGVLQFSYLGNSDAVISAVADKYSVSYEAAKNLLDLLAFEIVKSGAISTDTDTDIDDNDREYTFYSSSQRFVTKLKSPDDKRITVVSWMPRNKKEKKDEFFRTNKLYYVTHFLGVSELEASRFLEDYYAYLTDENYGNQYPMVDKNKDGTYVLPAKHFRVRIAGDKDIKWYKCTKCGRVSQFNMNGHCTTTRCGSTVKEVEPNILHKDNHFAKLYFSERMSPLFIKEHTAQLSKKESASYQEQFIKKEINALSCSTTFEMGVDVGDLETVFLRDVPPLPSNYAQRAGRAGRSINAAAYCLTFAKLSSHDLSFFKDPKRIISGTILPPLFKVDNEKIVRRHIYAIALSMFFASNPDQYNSNDADEFINKKGYQKFISWLGTKPERLKDMIKRSIPDIDDLYSRIGIDDYSWVDEFSGQGGVFTSLINEYESNIQIFERNIEKYKKNNELETATKIKRRLDNYKNNKLIDFLARGNILPRYGFPVDTVELEQNTTASNINKLRLSRDLSMAIAEYAPSSEIIADGRMYTSRYIKKSNIGNNRQEWHTAFIGKCNNPECQATNYSLTEIGDEGFKCASCGETMQKELFYESIEPRSGFITERKDKDVPLTKQEKNYRSDDYYIGNTQSKQIGKNVFKFKGIKVTVESTTNDSLMVKSFNNFYVCPVCGYAIAEDETVSGDPEANKLIKQGAHKITTVKKHESCLGQFSCNCQELVKYSLHHTFNTDVAKISFGCDTSNYKMMVSTMYAILYAISDELRIERRDIKACLSMKIIDHKVHNSIIIYDAVPGGAGHSRRLVTNDGKMLFRIFSAALKNMERCHCEPSCYSCLRSYENQKIHDDLDRKLAAEFLKQLIGPVEVVDAKKQQ